MRLGLRFEQQSGVKSIFLTESVFSFSKTMDGFTLEQSSEEASESFPEMILGCFCSLIIFRDGGHISVTGISKENQLFPNISSVNEGASCRTEWMTNP